MTRPLSTQSPMLPLPSCGQACSWTRAAASGPVTEALTRHARSSQRVLRSWWPSVAGATRTSPLQLGMTRHESPSPTTWPGWWKSPVPTVRHISRLQTAIIKTDWSLSRRRHRLGVPRRERRGLQAGPKLGERVGNRGLPAPARRAALRVGLLQVDHSCSPRHRARYDCIRPQCRAH